MQIGRWIKQQADVQGRAAKLCLLIDLKGFDVPLFTSATHPMMAKKHYDDARVQAWSDAIDACDAFIFVTPSTTTASGAFKNAVDSLGSEWVGKPYAVVGYGAVGGVRAIEELAFGAGELLHGRHPQRVEHQLFTHFADGAFVPNAHQNDEVKALFDALENLTGRLAWASTRIGLRDNNRERRDAPVWWRKLHRTGASCSLMRQSPACAGGRPRHGSVCARDWSARVSVADCLGQEELATPMRNLGMAWKVAPVDYAATAAGEPAVSTRRRTRAMRVHTTQIANEIVVTYG